MNVLSLALSRTRWIAAAILLLAAAPILAESVSSEGNRIAGGQIVLGAGRSSDFSGFIIFGRVAEPAAAGRALSPEGNVVRGTVRFPLERRATALDWMLYE